MSDTPVSEFVWEITLPAVRAAWSAGRDYIASGKHYVPRVGLPRYKENASGWPATVQPGSLGLSDDAPTDWSKMFGPAGGKLTCVAVEDVPELNTAIDKLVEATEADRELGSRMNTFNHSENKEWREKQLRFDYRDQVVAQIIARAEATGAVSDEDLLSIYLELEQARFAETLTGDLVVPVVLTDFGLENRLHLGGSVYIERLSEDLQCARAPHSLDSLQVNSYLTAAATHALVVEQIRIDNSNYAERVLGRLWGRAPVHTSDIESIDRAIQLVHIITGAPTGYTQILVRPHGWADSWTGALPALFEVGTKNNYPPIEGGKPPWNDTRSPLGKGAVADMPRAFKRLMSAPKFVGLAARRSIRAMMRTDDEDRTLDAMIGIEALLLDNQPELKFRMALRAAAALHQSYDPHTIFGLAKSVYDHRSEIAHGGTPKKATFNYDGQTWRSADIAPVLLQALLRSYLLSDEPWDKDALDSRVLAALAAYSPNSIGMSSGTP